MLHRWMKTKEITEKLKEIYQLDSYQINAIIYWIGEIKLGRTYIHSDDQHGKTADSGIKSAIQVQIENNPHQSK